MLAHDVNRNNHTSGVGGRGLHVVGVRLINVSHNLTCALALCRQVSIEEGESKAKELNVMFIETSAKAGYVMNMMLCGWKCTLTTVRDRHTLLHATYSVLSARSHTHTLACVCVLLCRNRNHRF